MLEYWMDELEKGSTVDVVYTDFEKAFDKWYIWYIEVYLAVYLAKYHKNLFLVHCYL